MKTKHARISLLLGSATTFTLFLILTYVVARERLVQVDFDTTVRLQDHATLRLDAFFSTFSLIGSFELTTITFIILILLHVRKHLYRVLLLAMHPLFHIVEVLGKTMVDQEPPPFMFLRYTFGFHFPSSYASTDFYSYPSGHVGRTALLTVIGILLVLKSNKNVWVKLGVSGAFIGILGIMMVSRVYLGEHWTSDVIGGALLGTGFAFLSIAFW